MQKIVIIFLLLVSSIEFFAQTTGERNIHYSPSTTGNIGLVMIPTARFARDKEVIFSINSLSKNHAFLPNKEEKIGEKLYSVSVNFLPFAEIIATVTRPDNIEDVLWGVGDRSIKGRLKILSERKYIPAFAIGLHDVFSANHYQSAAYIVCSKEVAVSKTMIIDNHIGYAANLLNSPWKNIELFENSQPFLSGLFFGTSLYYKNLALMCEYDSEKFNSAISILLFNHFGFQLKTIGFNSLSFGLNARLILGEPISIF